MEKDHARSRRAYIVEALLEYLVSLLVTGTFLSAILKQIGVSDALTGIISSFISFACCIQLFSGLVVRPGRSVRRTMLLFSVLNEMLFASLYLIPFFPVSQSVKTAAFVVMILVAYLLLNLSTPAKFKWMMDHVDPSQRGVFTARKEMVSLVGGMVFSLLMGRLVDHYKEIGQERTGSVLCCITLFAVALLHAVTLLCVEDEITDEPQQKLSARLRDMASFLVTDKALRRLIVLDLLWKSAIYISTPFQGTYLIGELGFTLTEVSLITMAGSITRVLVSPLTGRLADKRGWSRLLTGCILVAAVGFLLNTITAPASRYFCLAEKLCYAIAMAGVNSGMSNITYDYVPAERFSLALGTRNAISGVVGFLATLLGSAVVTAVQGRGDRLLGHTVYAQQILSLCTGLLMLLAVLYLKKVICRMPKLGEKSAETV